MQLDQINDRYNQLNKLLQSLRDTCNQILEKMSPEVSLVNQIVAEVESASGIKKKLLDENRTVQNDTELKRQEGQKILDTFKERAQEYLNAAIANHVKAVQILDSVKILQNDVDLRERKNKLVAALGE